MAPRFGFRAGFRTAFSLAPAAFLLLCGLPAAAQISLSTALNLALQNSPRVKIAGTDLARAKAVLAESKEVFVPTVAANGGVGRAIGAPLAPPVIFSIGAQSLVFNFAQPNYIRAARSGVTAAQLALTVARTDVSEDTTNAYIALDNALERRSVQADALDVANRLVRIVQDRYTAGVDPHIELTRAKRTAAQIRLQELQLEDEIALNFEHLAVLTGLPATGWKTVHDSIPTLQPPAVAANEDPGKYQGLNAAFATAQARRYTARGDRRYVWLPQLSFSSNYSRISDAFNSYDDYYPHSFGFSGHSFNSLSFGIQLSVPLLDMVHRARAREAAADAAHALYDAEIQQANFIEGRARLRHNTLELAARADLASLDHDLAQDDLEALEIRLRAPAGSAPGPQSNPKDEENARLAERQRTLDMLAAELQLRQAEISLMRQEGSLANWLAATIPGATEAPAAATHEPAPNLPATLGTTPAPAGAGAGSLPGTAPTTGTTPSTLPSSPVSNPAPASPNPPQSAPSTSPGTQPSTPPPARPVPATPHTLP